MGTLSGLQEYQVYVYNCEKFNKSAEKDPLLEWQDLIDATVYIFFYIFNIFSRGGVRVFIWCSQILAKYMHSLSGGIHQ